MTQRRPRLGDVLDDYCPRERRITNHVIVAMIEDDVKQTRCSTCAADHDYKQARTPSPRRQKSVAAIHDGADAFEAKPVLSPPPRAVPEAADPGDDGPSLPSASSHVSADSGPATMVVPPDSAEFEPVPRAASASVAPEPVALDDAEPAMPEDEGPVHRRLIRAALPRPEGYVPERKEPEFTIRQPGAGGRGRGEVDGNSVGYRQKGQRQQGGFGGGHAGAGGGHSRFGGQRNGPGQHSQRPAGGRGPNGPRSGRPEGSGSGPGAGSGAGPGANNGRGQRQGPGSGRRRGGR